MMIPRMLSIRSWFLGSDRPGFFSGTFLLLSVMLCVHAAGIQASLSLGPEGHFPRLRDVFFHALSHDDAPSLLVNLCCLLLVGPCQERRWGTVGFLVLSAVTTAALPCTYSLVLWVWAGEASRVCGYSAVQMALFTAQCRQIRVRRLLPCLPPWLLPWLALLWALLLLPGTPALLHFCAICIGHNYSPSFIRTLQELESFSFMKLIPKWAYISSSSRLRLPTHSTSVRLSPQRELLHSPHCPEETGPSISTHHSAAGSTHNSAAGSTHLSETGCTHNSAAGSTHLSETGTTHLSETGCTHLSETGCTHNSGTGCTNNSGTEPGWRTHPSQFGMGYVGWMNPSPSAGSVWEMNPSQCAASVWEMNPPPPEAGFRWGGSRSEAELVEEQLLHAGILASLNDHPAWDSPDAPLDWEGPNVSPEVLSARDALQPSEAKVELPKSSVSSLRLQQLERMGFPTDKAVVALAASRQLEGAVSLLINDSIGSEAVVVGAKSQGPK